MGARQRMATEDLEPELAAPSGCVVKNYCVLNTFLKFLHFVSSENNMIVLFGLLHPNLGLPLVSYVSC